ncbi:hypothetical protein HK099_003779 [Clydaea vesicula]|uniref:Uncharacterized protein n=1 Tax=Clydaea vesicula TaxID=447962 RepID=A0AAD5U2X4_9FUNG|nr:hypothetical protein HK099_003779 [Clydaea vesicula]
MNIAARAINVDELQNYYPQNVNVDAFLGQIFSELNGTYGYYNLHYVRFSNDIQKSNTIKFQLRDLDLNQTPAFQLVPRAKDIPEKDKLFKFLVGFIDNNNKWRAILRCTCCGLMIFYDSIQRNIQQGNARDEHLKNESRHFCTGKDPTKKCKDREALAKFAKNMNLIDVSPVLKNSPTPNNSKVVMPVEKLIKKRKADNAIIKMEETSNIYEVSYAFMRPKMNREGLEWLEEQRRLNLSILIKFHPTQDLTPPDLNTYVTDTDSNSASSPSSSTQYGSHHDALSDTTHYSISIDQFLGDTPDFYLPIQYSGHQLRTRNMQQTIIKSEPEENLVESENSPTVKTEKIENIKTEENNSISSSNSLSIPIISTSLTKPPRSDSLPNTTTTVPSITVSNEVSATTVNLSHNTSEIVNVEHKTSSSSLKENPQNSVSSLVSTVSNNSLPSQENTLTQNNVINSLIGAIPDISDEEDLASELPPYDPDSSPIVTSKVREANAIRNILPKNEEFSNTSLSKIQFVMTKVKSEDIIDVKKITDGMKDLDVRETDKQKSAEKEKGWKSVTGSLKNIFTKESKSLESTPSLENIRGDSSIKYPLDYKNQQSYKKQSIAASKLKEKEKDIKFLSEKEQLKQKSEKELLKQKDELHFNDFSEKDILSNGAGESLFQMGKIFFKEKKFSEAVKIFEVASKLDSASAQYHLGFCYLNGLGVEKDLNEAYKYFSLSSAYNTDSAFYLGLLLYNGLGGIEKNYAESYKYFKLAADDGNPYALCYLGQCHYYGHGTEKNLYEAYKYFNCSEELNCNMDSQYFLARFFEKGLGGIGKDLDKAREYYKSSANQGHMKAKENLGNLNVWENLNKF